MGKTEREKEEIVTTIGGGLLLSFVVTIILIISLFTKDYTITAVTYGFNGVLYMVGMLWLLTKELFVTEMMARRGETRRAVLVGFITTAIAALLIWPLALVLAIIRIGGAILFY